MNPLRDAKGVSIHQTEKVRKYPCASEKLNKRFFTGKRVLVMGLGRFGGGLDVAKFAWDCGAKVTVTDLASAERLAGSLKQLEEFANIQYHLGSHDPADFEQADVIVVNPAVGPDNDLLKLALNRNKFITSQINIFFEICPALIIGITGANGKSTTAALTAHLLRAGLGEQCDLYREVWLSGNIGNEPLLTIADQIAPDDLVVLELSSFQIEQLAQIQKAPQVALLTNLTPNHLDRYGTFTEYCAAKESIFKFQRANESCPAVSIFNGEDEVGAGWFEKYKDHSDRICIKFAVEQVPQEVRSVFPVPGRANLSNLAAAITIARHFGVQDEWIKTCLPEFKPLPHRLELVADVNGVRWYNDSKATTPEGAIAALEAFDVPRIIIAGGYDKRVSFDELGRRIAREAKAAILIGQTAKKIADAIAACPKNQTEVEIVPSLTKAVERAIQLAVNGDVVLLSPACASYDMFDNFEQRGQEFIGLVRRMNT